MAGIITTSLARDCSPDNTPPCPRSHLLPLLLLGLLLTLIYANSFKGLWVFDDAPNIVKNSAVHLEVLNWEGISKTFSGVREEGFYRPLAYLSFGLNHYFHGLDPWGYHLVNLAIHALAGLFLYLFIFQTLHLPRLRAQYQAHAGTIALLAVTLWATHPIQVTSVTYLVQRMASLAALFSFIALFCYLRGRTNPDLKRRIAWFLLCAFSGLLAVASKENAVLLPLSIYLFDLLLIQGVTRSRLKQQLLFGTASMMVLVGLIFLIANPMTILSGYEIRDFTLFERLLTQPRVLLHYLSLMVYPIMDRFAMVHDLRVSTSLFTPWTTLPAIAFWFGWCALAIFWAKTRPLIAFCLLFFVVNHIAESSIVPLELVFEHRNYLPSASLFLLGALGIVTFWHHPTLNRKQTIRWLLATLLLVFIIGNGYTTMMRNAMFHHPILLWRENAAMAPGLSRVHLNLGAYYMGIGRNEEAIEGFQRAIDLDHYERITQRSFAHTNLGYLHLSSGRPNQAITHYQRALKLSPGNTKAISGAISTLLSLDDLKQAAHIMEQVLNPDADQNSPPAPIFKELNSLLLLKQADYQGAIGQAGRVMHENPHSTIALRVLGEAHSALGNHQLGRQYWQRHATVAPRHVETLLALLRQATLLEDEEQIMEVTRKLLAIKGRESWKSLFEELQIKNRSGKHLVLREPPETLLPMIRNGLRLELAKIDPL